MQSSGSTLQLNLIMYGQETQEIAQDCWNHCLNIQQSIPIVRSFETPHRLCVLDYESS